VKAAPKTRLAWLVALLLALGLLGVMPAAANGFGKTAPADGAVGVGLPVTLSWGAVPGAAWYAYCIDTIDDDACQTISWFGTDTATSAQVAGLAPYTTYYWQVFASGAPGGTVYADGDTWWSFTTGASAVPNDDFDTPTVIGALPYTTTQDVAEATTAGDDPPFFCSSGWTRYRTVWFRYVAADATILTIDTLGSDYDTVLGVWTGSRGSLHNVVCGDDISGSVYQSQVQFTAVPGTTYYVEVAAWSAADPASHLVLHVSETPVPQQKTFYSEFEYDGWVLEKDENSGKGGTLNAGVGTARMGDDDADRQWRSILHFDTAALPDNAVITGVTIRIKKQSIVGSNPFTTHGLLKVDMETGAYHDDPALERLDFHAVGSRGNVGRFIKTPAEGWYRAPLRAPSYPLVNLTGSTQFRLRFAIDDDDDGIADYLNFYTGNAPLDSQPQLVVDYYVP